MTRTAGMTSTLGALVALSLPPLHADKGPTDYLADRADAVVVGEIKARQDTGKPASLSIVRTIKGGVSPTTTVNVSNVSRCPTVEGQYGLWFLAKKGDQWELLPVDASGLRSPCWIPLPKASSPAAVRAVSAPSTDGDRIAVEIVAALLSDPRSMDLHFVGSLLGGIHGGALLPELYRILRSNPDPDLKFLGLGGQVLLEGAESTSALAEIAGNLDVLPKLRAGVCRPIWGFHSTDPAAIRILGKIASSPDLEIQQCAANALQTIHTQDTLPFLAQLLDSTDARIQASAVAGFSKFVNNRPILPPIPNIPGSLMSSQGPTPYRTTETDKHAPGVRAASSIDASDVEFWKTWWVSMKDKLGGRNP